MAKSLSDQRITYHNLHSQMFSLVKASYPLLVHDKNSSSAQIATSMPHASKPNRLSDYVEQEPTSPRIAPPDCSHFTMNLFLLDMKSRGKCRNGSVVVDELFASADW